MGKDIHMRQWLFQFESLGSHRLRRIRRRDHRRQAPGARLLQLEGDEGRGHVQLWQVKDDERKNVYF